MVWVPAASVLVTTRPIPSYAKLVTTVRSIAGAAAHDDSPAQPAMRVVAVLRHARLVIQDAGAGRIDGGVAGLAG